MAGNRIRELRRALGMSQERLGELVGLEKMSISRIERGLQALMLDKLEDFARALKCSPGDILNLSDLRSEVIPTKDQSPPNSGAASLDVPLMGAMSRGDEGGFVLTGEIIQYVRRLPGLAQNRQVFALFVTTDLMAPWQQPGDKIFVNPARPARPGDYVVVEFKPEREGEPPLMLLKLLVSHTPSRLIVEQYRPAKKLEFPANTVSRVLKVMTLDELMAS